MVESGDRVGLFDGMVCVCLNSNYNWAYVCCASQCFVSFGPIFVGVIFQLFLLVNIKNNY